MALGDTPAFTGGILVAAAGRAVYSVARFHGFRTKFEKGPVKTHVANGLIFFY
jgi:hypothetical protein